MARTKKRGTRRWIAIVFICTFLATATSGCGCSGSKTTIVYPPQPPVIVQGSGGGGGGGGAAGPVGPGLALAQPATPGAPTGAERPVRIATP